MVLEADRDVARDQLTRNTTGTGGFPDQPTYDDTCANTRVGAAC